MNTEEKILLLSKLSNRFTMNSDLFQSLMVDFNLDSKTLNSFIESNFFTIPSNNSSYDYFLVPKKNIELYLQALEFYLFPLENKENFLFEYEPLFSFLENQFGDKVYELLPSIYVL